VHHGETGWQAPTRFEALIDLPADAPEAVWAHVPRFCFALDDLTAISSEALRQREVSMGTRLVLAALKEVRTIPDALLLLRGLADLMRGARHEPGAIRRIIQYIGAVRRADDIETIIDILATEVGPEEAQMMQTLAEAWEQRGRQEGEQRGRQEGEQKGRQEGERKLLVRQLRRRFGELPAAVLARIEHADEATLERWSEELLDAPSLTALFPPA
jgi:hypothetical protein